MWPRRHTDYSVKKSPWRGGDGDLVGEVANACRKHGFRRRRVSPLGDIRRVGNEDGFAPEENWNVIDRHGYLRWRPGEADTPLRERHWLWHPNAEQGLKPLDKLLDIYRKTVGRGAQLVLGLAPDNRGLLPEVDAARLKEFGEAVRRLYGSNLATGGNLALDGDADTYWSAASGSISDRDLRSFLAAGHVRPRAHDGVAEHGPASPSHNRFRRAPQHSPGLGHPAHKGVSAF